MKIRSILSLAVVTVAAAAMAASATKLTLTPGTISTGAEAYWVKPNKGNGNGSGTVLRLAKNVPTAAFEAAGADIGGILGTNPYDLTGLAFTVKGGTVEGGSPRWNIYYGPVGGGFSGVVFLAKPGVVGDRISFSQQEISAALTAAGAPADSEIKYLQIIVDVQGSVDLDNITVGVNGKSTTFTADGKSNHGNGKIKP